MVTELGLLVVLVEGDAVRSQDKVDRLPVLSRRKEKNALARMLGGQNHGATYLCLLGALLDTPALDDTVDFKAAVLVHGSDRRIQG